MLLPEWAERKSDGSYMEVGAQLRTRDGRRRGNAFVNNILPFKNIGMVAEVITDAGSRMVMVENELEEAFYEPVWIMKIDVARRKFIREGE